MSLYQLSVIGCGAAIFSRFATMRLLFMICALVLCLDTFLEIQLLHKAKEETVALIDDEQQESNSEQSSLSQHDKANSHFLYSLTMPSSFNILFFTTHEYLFPAGFIRCLYQPPEV